MSEPTRDRFILSALSEGRLRVDFDAGVVYHHGRRTGWLRADGYCAASVGSRIAVLVHRVVWIAAHGPIPPGMQVNHRNQVRHDNRLTNLELVTAAENIAHKLGTAYYSRVRPEDGASVDQQWLSRVMDLAASGEATREQITALMSSAAEEPEPPRRCLYGSRPEARYNGRRRTR